MRSDVEHPVEQFPALAVEPSLEQLQGEGRGAGRAVDRPWGDRPPARDDERSQGPTADGGPAPQQALQAGRWRITWGAGREAASLTLEPGLLPVGSHPENTVLLRDPCVSRFHCRLHLRDDGRLWLRDLGSRNGTFVDGLRVTEAELLPGAELRVGDTALRLRRDEAEPAALCLPGLTSRDPAMAQPLALLRRVAPSRLPVLLRGETGAGKEVAAHALHACSGRARGPFVPLNCGAISHELAEAELFGHERGAFTGAVGASPGAFGAADGGTLFLDEVGELPPGLQVKLLRALESEEVKPVGAARPVRVDVRIVCATHRDLRALVAEGRFREDLYYRLRGAEVLLPPLRARPADLLPLAEEFLEAEAPRARFSPDARAALKGHSWPGNVRELKLVVRLAALLRDGSVVRGSDLRLDTAPPFPQRPHGFESLHGYGTGVSEQAFVPERAQPQRAPAPAQTAPADQLRGRTLEELETMAIRAAFERHGGVRRAMSKDLGIAKSSLLRKLSKLGLREATSRAEP
jgi:DNA-binding NtrC family response regulator